MYVGQIFVKKAKNDPRTLFEQSKQEEIWKLEKCPNPSEYRKRGLFGHSKRQNSAVFQDRDLKFCTFIYLQAFFYIYSVFFQIQSFSKMKVAYKYEPYTK